MKTTDFIIFISVVLLVYIGTNFYIFIRGNQALPDIPWIKITFYVIFTFLILAYIIGMILERTNPSEISTLIKLIGAYWLGAMLYFFLIIVLIDLLRAVNHFLPFFPQFISENYERTKLITAGFSIMIVLVILIFASYNAYHPITRSIDISMNKQANKLKSLKIVMVSDIHIGAELGKKPLEKLVDSINSLNPDIVLMPGDIIDEAAKEVIRLNLGESLKNIKTKYGVYASTGNHEYIGGIDEAVQYINSVNIILLRDNFIVIDSSFYLVGREDHDKKRFFGTDRKPLNEIMKKVDRTLPVILLDHQPIHLEEAENNGIDLQLSGHTHNGQIFPFNYITRLVYELDWGYKRRGETQYYISCGYGTWGPPMRLGNKPEIVVFNINFRESTQE
jgi:uncharacterized protein